MSVALPKHMKPDHLSRKTIVCVAIALFAAEVLYGLYIGIVQEMMPGDAISRVANAYYVLAVKPVRLSSIGLIWNPLPSLMELPLVALSPLWKPLISRGISGSIITALFSALSVGVLLKTFSRFCISKFYSFLIALFFALHPYIFRYGANGMSEAMFFFFIIYCICNLILWFREGSSSYIVKIAFGLVGGFLTRYETIPFAMGIGFCVVLNILYNPKEKKYWSAGNRKRERYRYIEGTLVMLYTPAVYAGIVWILLCWVITGNPFYFLNSNYSNSGQSAFADGASSLPVLVSYISRRAIPFLPPFFAIVLMRIVRKSLFKADFLCLLALVLSLLGFHILLYWRGSSFGWLRFFCYSLPICIAWLPYELSTYQESEPAHFRTPALSSPVIRTKNVMLNFFKVLIPVSLIVSVFLVQIVMSDYVIADQEGGASAFQENLQVADYINNHLPDKIVLTDVFTTYNVAMNVDHFDNLVVSSSLNFKQCVADPVGNGINYLLIPNPMGISNNDAINLAYPGLYVNGADWCAEEKDFGDFKLFRITG
ncbi:hypothetical protein EQM14_05050 [Caproiciproducens sp. NJN-50]|uniref:hypothetical protein n=1 Tax=Acutalibacteraceae TaxID=3082771 RepID=UPI000FFE2235|nr:MULTISPECIES: hypothetical protein [Acutalibacteraceae]QAT49193.1 hypothetical protein EQM14_05050 [Caproiciproducens sp. NJN-50]